MELDQDQVLYIAACIERDLDIFDAEDFQSDSDAESYKQMLTDLYEKLMHEELIW
jgi:hypothetical protein